MECRHRMPSDGRDRGSTARRASRCVCGRSRGRGGDAGGMRAGTQRSRHCRQQLLRGRRVRVARGAPRGPAPRCPSGRCGLPPPALGPPVPNRARCVPPPLGGLPGRLRRKVQGRPCDGCGRRSVRALRSCRVRLSRKATARHVPPADATVLLRTSARLTGADPAARRIGRPGARPWVSRWARRSRRRGRRRAARRLRTCASAPVRRARGRGGDRGVPPARARARRRPK